MRDAAAAASATAYVLVDGAAGDADGADHLAAAFLIGMPPREGARPPLVSSRPCAGAPGLQYSQTASLFA